MAGYASRVFVLSKIFIFLAQPERLATKPLVNPGPRETWLLVTAASHMPRAVGCFRAAGFPVVAYPVGFAAAGKLNWLFNFRFDAGFRSLGPAVKEYAGLLAYRLLGYTNELFPAP